VTSEELTPHPIFSIVGWRYCPKGAAMRLDLGGVHIVMVWTDSQYRNEVARLMRGITTSSIKLVRVHELFGLRFVILRRVKTAQ